MTGRTLLGTVALCAIAAVPAGAVVESGDVVPFRSIAGASIGAPRATVLAGLGAPLSESDFGVLSYSDRYILDVYLTRRGARGRVRQIVASGPGFCARGVPAACSMATGGVTAMRRAYPRRFRRVVDRTGDTIFWWCGRVRGRHISTSFNVDVPRNAILTWYLIDHGSRCPTLAQVRDG